ncbi:Piwi-domain-containing protein [Peniophora sp. CONT]|nr:Piwi-domain-containing protein [Peniophora sp. CONT]
MSSSRGRGSSAARGGGPQGQSHHYQPYPSPSEHSARGRGGGGPSRGYGGRGGGGGGGGGPPAQPDLAPGERRAMVVRTNIFPITRFPTARFYQYTTIDPLPRTTGLKRVIIDELETSNTVIAQRRGIYDGANLFYSQHEQISGQYEVELKSRRPVKKDQPKPLPSIFHVTLQRTASDVIEPLRPHEVSGNMILNPVAINLLQLLSQEAARRKSAYWNARRSVFFDGVKTAQLGGGVVLWHGFLQSVKAVRGNIVINVDVASTLMWTPGHLLDAVRSLLENAGFRHPLEQFDETHPMWRAIGSMLKNLRVKYTSTGGVTRERRIRGIVPRACTIIFTLKNGTQLTVGQYFHNILNRPLNPKLMGIYLDDEKKAVVPAEICTISPGQRYMRQLNREQQTAALRDMTQIPGKRWENIAQGMQFFEHRNSPYLLQANMDVSSSYMITNCEQIGPPQVRYEPQISVNVSQGGWDMPRNGRFMESTTVSHWAAYDITHNGDVNKMQRFLGVFQNCCRDSGMIVPATPPILTAMQGGFQREMVNHHGKPPRDFDTKRKRYQPLLLFFLSSSNASEIRKLIKYWGEVGHGVPTQCIMIDKLNPTPLFGNNIAMKVNAKLGGVNCVAYNPHLTALSGNTLILGADVTHPSPGILNRPSFPAVVGSLNDSFTQYASCMDVQEPRRDSIENLCEMVRYLIGRWFRQHRGHLPAHVIYFRDGISEGEYERAGVDEKEQIEKAWNLAIEDLQLKISQLDPSKDYIPPDPAGTVLNLSFIVVEKRHNVRFGPEGPLGKQNVPAGTVVTQDVIARGYENFYIVSQRGLLGTSRPAHCVILKRDPILSFEMCQELIYFLCHVCARTTKSVSLPAPIYFADLLCAEALNYIRPGHPIFEDDNLTVASGEGFMINMQGWKDAMATDKRGPGNWRPGPDFVHPNVQNRLFFI